MLKFLFARHRATYIRLAFKYWTLPEHVYQLAHGKSHHGGKDSQICHELLELKIVHHHHHSHNPNDYHMK